MCSRITLFVKAALLLSFLGALPTGLSSPAWAQTEENQHQQNFTPGSQVNATPKEADPKLSFTERYAPPETISSFGHRIDWLFQYTSWVAFLFFVIMAGALTYFIVVYRERPGHKAYYTHGHSKGNKMVTRVLDLAVFFSLDLVLMVSSYKDTFALVWNYPTGDDVIKIEVMPQQWAWNFKYAGADGKFLTADDIDTINDMRIPKGRPILVQIKSKDVIHGFTIPNVRLQIDAIPGEITKFWFDAQKTGDFELACYHLCGTSHYKMKGFVKVIEVEDYNAWIEENSRWSAAKYDETDKLQQWGWNWGI